mmetsp:Transcript_20879/g.83211  ORF Transcript_20879/g.83211 Transcript_20879/m.83211 type:complete len:202 (+) Transcript_20879:934-1539(+)
MMTTTTTSRAEAAAMTTTMSRASRRRRRGPGAARGGGPRSRASRRRARCPGRTPTRAASCDSSSAPVVCLVVRGVWRRLPPPHRGACCRASRGPVRPPPRCCGLPPSTCAQGVVRVCYRRRRSMSFFLCNPPLEPALAVKQSRDVVPLKRRSSSYVETTHRDEVDATPTGGVQGLVFISHHRAKGRTWSSTSRTAEPGSGR